MLRALNQRRTSDRIDEFLCALCDFLCARGIIALNRKDRKAREEDLSQIHDQQLGFRHFLNRIPQTLATQTGVFDSTIWHVIDAE